MGAHRVNYTIFAALRVGFRGRFPPPQKVSVVRRSPFGMANNVSCEQIRVLILYLPWGLSPLLHCLHSV